MQPLPIPSLGKQWSHCPFPSLGKQWSHSPSPSLGKQWSHCPSLTYGTPTPTHTQPMARNPTQGVQPIPNLRVYTNETQHMAREPTHGSQATQPQQWDNCLSPTMGPRRTEPDLQSHPYTNAAKEQVQFLSVPKGPLLLWTPSDLRDSGHHTTRVFCS